MRVPAIANPLSMRTIEADPFDAVIIFSDAEQSTSSYLTRRPK
jgi:hypothetical protein